MKSLSYPPTTIAGKRKFLGQYAVLFRDGEEDQKFSRQSLDHGCAAVRTAKQVSVG